jgi:ligand-binding sensor domain-containing protein
MKRLLAVLLLFVGCVGLYAQSENWFEGVNSINPLSHNSATYIHQDKLGFLWVGTFNGLNKYDGYSFKTYKFNLLNDSPTNCSCCILFECTHPELLPPQCAWWDKYSIHQYYPVLARNVCCQAYMIARLELI